MMNINDYYKREYATALKLSDNFKDLRSFGLFMKDISCWRIDAAMYCLKLQEDLYSKGLLPFKITSPREGDKLNECEPAIREILVHVWIALCRATGYNQLPSTLSNK